MKTIFIDMDGVVADFNKKINQELGRDVDWNNKQFTEKEWDEVKSINNFYRELDLLPHSTELVGYCTKLASKFNVQFLTALPSKTKWPEAQEDKVYWGDKYFPGYKVNFGPYSQDKWKWAKAGDILIDDRPSNIRDWAQKGNGIGILYKNNFLEVVDTLEKVFNKDGPLCIL